MITTPDAKRRFNQLFTAALNLGMNEADAVFYAKQTLAKETTVGEWHVKPQSAEALRNDTP